MRTVIIGQKYDKPEKKTGRKQRQTREGLSEQQQKETTEV
jgi:hypothetical protein